MVKSFYSVSTKKIFLSDLKFSKLWRKLEFANFQENRLSSQIVISSFIKRSAFLCQRFPRKNGGDGGLHSEMNVSYTNAKVHFRKKKLFHACIPKIRGEYIHRRNGSRTYGTRRN